MRYRWGMTYDLPTYLTVLTVLFATLFGVAFTLAARALLPDDAVTASAYVAALSDLGGVAALMGFIGGAAYLCAHVIAPFALRFILSLLAG